MALTRKYAGVGEHNHVMVSSLYAILPYYELVHVAIY